MSPLDWFKKESPLFGLTGLWGGVGSNLVSSKARGAAMQYERITSGNETWTVPDGVTSISVIVVGGGGGGGGDGPGGGGGGGGGLTWKNNISVSAGQQFTISCGAGGAGSANGTASNGQNSYFNSVNTCKALGGSGGVGNQVGGAGGGGAGQGTGEGRSMGGAGGAGNSGGGSGGGAAPGNYQNGGAGANGGYCPTYPCNATLQNGSSGGGAGGHSGWGNNGSAGGGTLLYGEGTTVGGNQARAGQMSPNWHAGEVGSLVVGGQEVITEESGQFTINTRTYPSAAYKECDTPGSGGRGNVWGAGYTGGAGAVRIMWPGDQRTFPNTRTANEFE